MHHIRAAFGDLATHGHQVVDRHESVGFPKCLGRRFGIGKNRPQRGIVRHLVADNYGVETVPSKPGSGSHAMLPLHEHCLFKLGVNLGELWHLSPLAAWLRQNGRSRFFLTAPPLRLPGAVGSPATPVATV